MTSKAVESHRLRTSDLQQSFLNCGLNHIWGEASERWGVMRIADPVWFSTRSQFLNAQGPETDTKSNAEQVWGSLGCFTAASVPNIQCVHLLSACLCTAHINGHYLMDLGKDTGLLICNKLQCFHHACK